MRVRVGDVVLATRVEGTGEPVLLLHGWPQTSHAWRHVVPALAQRHRVVVPDLPGFGASSIPADGYDKATVAGHLRGLMHALGHERYHVVGRPCCPSSSSAPCCALRDHRIRLGSGEVPLRRHTTARPDPAVPRANRSRPVTPHR